MAALMQIADMGVKLLGLPLRRLKRFACQSPQVYSALLVTVLLGNNIGFFGNDAHFFYFGVDPSCPVVNQQQLGFKPRTK